MPEISAPRTSNTTNATNAMNNPHDQTQHARFAPNEIAVFKHAKQIASLDYCNHFIQCACLL